MFPILLSIAGALAGKAVVTAIEAIASASSSPSPTPLTKSDISPLSATPPPASVVKVSAAGAQASIASRYDPARLSPQRLATLAEEMKSAGMLSPAERAAMLRAVIAARQADLAAGKGNNYLNPRDMTGHFEQLALDAAKKGDKEAAAANQRVAQILLELKQNAPKSA